MRKHYPLIPPTPAPEIDLNPIADRLSQLESKVQPDVTITTVSTSTAEVIEMASEVLSTMPAPTIATLATDIVNSWYSKELSDGLKVYNPASEMVLGLLKWTDTGYEFRYQGLTGNWVLREFAANGSITSRTVTASAIALTTKTYTSSCVSIQITPPGDSAVFTSRKPRTDVDTGWTKTQDTRLQSHHYLYTNADKNVKVFWCKDSVYVAYFGLPGNWLLDHTTVTGVKPQQMLFAESLDAVSDIFLEGGVNHIKVTTPDGLILELHRPINVPTWQCIEKPYFGNGLEWEWSPPSVGISNGQCYFDWRKRAYFDNLVRITFYPNTSIEFYKNNVAQAGSWYRLFKANGTIIEGKLGATPTIYTNQQFAAIQLLPEIGIDSATFPEGRNGIFLPIPIIPKTKPLVPQIWEQYIAKLEFLATDAGKELKAAIDRIIAAETKNTAQDTKIATIEAKSTSQDARLETLEAARSTFTTFNAGTFVTFGTLQYTIPTSGNRSLQVRSVNGSVNIRWVNWLNWDTSINPSLLSATVTTSSKQYLYSSWNFTAAGNRHTAIVEDTTNNKRYRVDCTINNNYSNNVLVVENIT